MDQRASTFPSQIRVAVSWRLDAGAYLVPVSSCAGWPVADLIATPRLIVEPLRIEHADEMAALLDDAGLHEFIGGQPETLEQLRSRYARLVVGTSVDGEQGWLNWIVRDRRTGAAVGAVQATVRRTGGALSAELAWVIATDHQRQGFAKEAASGVLEWLRERRVREFVAHVHPKHAASIAVAMHLGFEPTALSADGETRFVRVER